MRKLVNRPMTNNRRQWEPKGKSGGSVKKLNEIMKGPKNEPKRKSV